MGEGASECGVMRAGRKGWGGETIVADNLSKLTLVCRGERWRRWKGIGSEWGQQTPQNEVKSVFVCVISADSQVVQLICPCIVTAQLPCNVIGVSVWV